MFTTPQPPAADRPAVAHGSPVTFDGPRIPLYTPEFAADPHGAYREMRSRFGSLVPVDLAPDTPATLVVGYRTAVRILHDPDHFPADPRAWQRGVPPDCPVLPMMGWRPTLMANAGEVHARYRQAVVDSVGEVDLHALHSTVERLAVPMINAFCETGTADLVRQYALPLAFAVINAVLGVPAEISRRLAAGMAAMVEAVDGDKGNAMVAAAMNELLAVKYAEPGDDVTTRLLHHPVRLEDIEVLGQVRVLYGAGIEVEQNLITNTLRLMLTDDRFRGDILGGSLSTRDALDEVLFTDPPMANFCASYPRQPILIDDVWLPAHQPVLISMTACNNDPEISGSEHTGNRAHLAWAAGPHACPARSMAYLIAQDAIDQLLDALPELRLAVPPEKLVWRPGPFHRALAALPVEFPKSPPILP
ncbi:cytochrome P450 [Nocardia transvalensis]|uniref:cytochrome P450 n=1 Tax=Nocardia transvalensis TaxID=37333 RepID=UPI001895677C|nr:cytochrome P450 [Nocardia transvalensis]MBF6331260.1 cytochrome P450 [Nocardia transvalensis]